MLDSFQALTQLLTTHNTKLASLLGLTSVAARSAALGAGKNLVREELELPAPSWQPSWPVIRDKLHVSQLLFPEDPPDVALQKTHELSKAMESEIKPKPAPVPVEQPSISEEALKAASFRVKQAKWDYAKERKKEQRRKEEKSLMEYAELARRAASTRSQIVSPTAPGVVTPILRHLLNDSDTQ